jgi:hypothetical protein
LIVGNLWLGEDVRYQFIVVRAMHGMHSTTNVDTNFTADNPSGRDSELQTPAA